jgi:glycogen synthase
MRILLVSNYFPPHILGGYELLAYDLSRRLASEGHQVTVASSRSFNGGTNGSEPFEVFRILQCVDLSLRIVNHEDALRLGLFVNLDNIMAMDALVKELAPDVIICFNLAGLGAFGLLHLFHSIGHRTVWYIADTLAGARQSVAEIARFARIFGTGDVFENIIFVAASSRVAAELTMDVGLPIDIKALIPCWFLRSPGPELGCCTSSDSLRLVFASRIDAHKGVEVLLDAAALVQDRGDIDFQIDVFGAGLVAQFMQRAYARNLESIVQYRGMLPKSEMLERYRDYDALAFPTWEREPFGGVAAEAAAAGCIPILTANIGAAEWLVGGLDCIKIRRDAEDLAAAIIDLALLDPSQRMVLRERVKRNARLMFDFERWFAKLSGLLEVAAAGRSQTSAPQMTTLLSLGLLTHIWRN